MALADWELLTADKLRDTAGKITREEIGRMIAQAAHRYSGVNPRMLVTDLLGDGAAFLFALPATYIEGFSRPVSVEYPIGKQDPQFLDDKDDFQIEAADQDPTTGAPRLRLRSLVLKSGAKARLLYTALHQVAATVDTVPIVDREACCALAASYGCRQLASYYAQTSDSTLGAATMSYRDKAKIYADQAVLLEQEFNNHCGIPKDGVFAASVSRDQDVDLQSGAGDRFYHPRIWR